MKLAVRGGLLLALLTGCAALPPGRAPEEGASQGPGQGTLSAASESLLMQGRAQRGDGDLAQASMTLERAIRIEPRAPELWLELARVRFDEGNYAQAEQLARKAGSLAAADDPLLEPVEELIDEALRRQGRSF